MAFMGGGNPISVAANFRLVFDTRSATRTATKYDAAMSQMAKAGASATAEANQKLEEEHAALLKKVKEDNEAADRTFETRSERIFRNVNGKSQEAFRNAKAAALKLKEGPRGGKSSGAYKAAEREYTQSLANMDAANTAYMAHLKELDIDAGAGLFDREAFGSSLPQERELQIGASKELLANGELSKELEKEITFWLEEQLRIDKQIGAAEKDNLRVKRQGANLSKEGTRSLTKGTIENNVALKEYRQNLMEANIQLQQMTQHIMGGLKQALMASAIAVTTLGFKLSTLTEGFKEFEQELQNANSIWQESNDVLYGASDTIVEFSTKYGIALNDATQGLYQMASAGLEASEAQEILGDTLKLSMAVQGDHETLSKLTIQTIKGFGLQMSDSAELTDKFAYAINKSLLEWQDLSSAVKFAMPFFTSTGQSVEQLLGALEVLTNRALEAGIAGRGLRQALAQFAKHADDNTAAFRKMGIEILNNEGEFKQFTEIAKEFSDQFGTNINDTEMMTKLLEDLNVRGATAFIHLVQNADEFSDAVDDLANSQGAAAEMADIQNQSLENQMIVMKNAAVASFYMSDATYENLGAMNEFDYLLQTATNDLRDFLFVQTEAGLVLNETGEVLKQMVNDSMRTLIGLLKEAYIAIGKFAQEGTNLGGVIEAMVMPLKLAVQLLGLLGAGAMEAIIMFKVMNTIIPQNTLYMLANAQSSAILGTVSKSTAASLGALAAAQGAANAAMFVGFLLINKEGEAAQALGYIILGLAGAYTAYAIAKAAGVSAVGGPAGLAAAGAAGAAFFMFMGKVMKDAMKTPEFEYKPIAPLEYTETTLDTGGTYMPQYMDNGGITQDHGLAMLQKGETVTSKTQNMVGGAQPITINVHGDVYDNDRFGEKVASVLHKAQLHQENMGMI